MSIHRAVFKSVPQQWRPSNLVKTIDKGVFVDAGAGLARAFQEIIIDGVYRIE